MKIKLTSIILFAWAFMLTAAIAQTNPPTFIKGSLEIQFHTKTQTDAGKPRPGVTDKYTLNVNIADSAIFRGNIQSLPYIAGTFSSQMGLLTYAVECDVVNPKNTSQTRNIGKLYGNVPVNQQNVYQFDQGGAKISVFAGGTAKGFDSKFSGLAFGKPPKTADSLFSKMRKEALKIGKQVKGKNVVIVVNNYDKMEFKDHKLAAGPVQIYPEVTVNGTMIYDYVRSSWYLQNMSATYAVDGRQFHDKLAGNIRWMESPDRSTTGEGEYQFNVRINEPPPTEESVFAAEQDESAFFSSDDAIPALLGTMKYKDVLSGETVTSSAIQIGLIGNKLTKQQTMYLFKLLLLSSIVPFNSE